MLKPRGTFKPEVYVVQPCPKNFPHPSRRLHTGIIRTCFAVWIFRALQRRCLSTTAAMHSLCADRSRRETKRSKKNPEDSCKFIPKGNLQGMIPMILIILHSFSSKSKHARSFQGSPSRTKPGAKVAEVESRSPIWYCETPQAGHHLQQAA